MSSLEYLAIPGSLPEDAYTGIQDLKKELSKLKAFQGIGVPRSFMPLGKSKVHKDSAVFFKVISPITVKIHTPGATRIVAHAGDTASEFFKTGRVAVFRGLYRK